MSKSISDREYKFKVIIPLIGFKSNIERFNFLEDISIEKFNSDEKEQLRTLFTAYGCFNIPDYDRCTHKIFGTFKAKLEPNKVPGPEQIIKFTEKCILGLRLVKPGVVGCNIAVQTVDCKEIGDCAFWINDCNIPIAPLYSKKPYRFNQDDSDRLLKIYTQLTNSNFQSPLKDLKVAFRWFNYSYYRVNDEDKILDLAIALESSLLFGIKEELRYKLAIRGASLLKETFDPKDSFSLLRALYDARSYIVHNGNNLSELSKDGNVFGIPLNEFTSKVENLTRYILVEYVKGICSGKRIIEINKEIDENILENLGK